MADEPEVIVRAYDVFGFRYESAEESEAVFARADGGLENVSVWRMSNPEKTEWLILVVDAAGDAADLDSDFDWGLGEPWPVPDDLAESLIRRRMATAAEALEEDPSRKRYRQRAHYGERGAKLYRTGRMEPNTKEEHDD
jgi:hypothetical protein